MSCLPITLLPVFHHKLILVSPLWVDHDGDAVVIAEVPRLAREYIPYDLFHRDGVRVPNQVRRWFLVGGVAVSEIYSPFV